MVQALLQLGAKPDPRNSNGITPMHYAARAGRLDIILLLKQQGVKVTESDASRRNILHHACACGHKDIVEWVCPKLKKPMKMLDRYGKTGLALAAYYGQTGVVEYLVTMWGADPFQKVSEQRHTDGVHWQCTGGGLMRVCGTD
jgi:ankyrin repeat protein